MIGIRNIFRVASNFVVTSNTVLANITGLSAPLAIGQKAKFRAVLYVALAGTASGAKAEALTSVAPGAWVNSNKIFNGVANTIPLVSVLTAQAAVSNALANIGNHLIELEGEVTGGISASNLTIQFAQLASDSGAATVLAGSSLEVVYES